MDEPQLRRFLMLDERNGSNNKIWKVSKLNYKLISKYQNWFLPHEVEVDEN